MTDAAAVVQTVLSSHPDLQDFGFGVFDSRRKTTDQIRSEIEIGRARMLENDSLKQFEAALGWLWQFPKIKHPNRRGTSYGLKHVAAHAIGYCTNGVFIAAAIAAGFEIKRDGPNARINISSKAWDRTQAISHHGSHLETGG